SQKDKPQALKHELLKQSYINTVSLGNLPMNDDMMASVLIYPSDTGNIRQQVMFKNVDSDYIGLYDIPLLAGNNVESSDTTRSFVINEVARKAFGFKTPEDAIGKQLPWGGKMI